MNRNFTCLSVRQIWADLIGSNRKPIETRSWRTEYRGELLICSSKQMDKSFTSPTLATVLTERYRLGITVCLVDLVDVRPLQPCDEALTLCPFESGRWAWVLENIRPVAPLPVCGSLKLFKASFDEAKLFDFSDFYTVNIEHDPLALQSPSERIECKTQLTLEV